MTAVIKDAPGDDDYPIKDPPDEPNLGTLIDQTIVGIGYLRDKKHKVAKGVFIITDKETFVVYTKKGKIKAERKNA